MKGTQLIGQNTQIAKIFEEIADLLDLKGGNPFRIRSYRSAAQSIRGTSEPLGSMVEHGRDLSGIPNIGESTAGKIHEILHLLLVAPAACLSEIFSKTKNKLEIIVTFLAILELIRLKEIVARQKELFGEIEITRNKENIIPYERRHKTETN